jgi:hypothetical protein
MNSIFLMMGQNNSIIIFNGEVSMVEVTASATSKIAEYFNGRKPSPIRIFLNEGG